MQQVFLWLLGCPDFSVLFLSCNANTRAKFKRDMARLPITEAFSRSDHHEIAEVLSQIETNTSVFNSQKTNQPISFG
jgi:hypothetical protein